MQMQSVHHLVPNGAGWQLSLHQTWRPDRVVPGRRPVLIVPGYGMNSFIFSYHPNGMSLEGWLVDAGFEVWRVDLRAQGGSISTGGSRDFSLEDLALVDLEVAIRAVLDRTRTGADRADVIGASLGGTLMFVHAALTPRPLLGSLVAMGSPLRWVMIHPAIRLAFSSPTLIGLVRFRGTRTLARFGLPVMARYTPWLLSVYMNPNITDTSAAREMVQTIEDPNRHINRQIAKWIRRRDLIVDGVNVTDAVAKLRNPLLTVVAHSDGVVPSETASFVHHHSGSEDRQLVVVGDETLAMAHADLFVSREAHERVFRPIADWLAARSAAGNDATGNGGPALEDDAVVTTP